MKGSAMTIARKPARLTTGSLFGAALSAILGLTTLAVAPPPPAMAQADPAALEFREALDVYGSWLAHRRWGDVWIPASVPQGWQPYTNGRWVFTDEWGWYWVSEDPWGWITDHYGRWAFDDGVGWLWIPGDEWAPAWVQWRQGTPQGAQFVGWAPLPPDDVIEEYVDYPAAWVFVPARYMTAPRIRPYIVPLARRPIFIRETYVVNRTVRLRERDRERGMRIAVNPGVPAPFVAAALRRPIRASEVRPVVLRGTVGVRGASEIRADEVRIYRERLGERRLGPDRRDGRDRRGPGDDRFRVIVRETPTTIRPATVMAPPARLERGEPGRLGDRPPRAAGVGPGQPGTVQPAPSVAPGTPGVAQPPRPQPAAPAAVQPAQPPTVQPAAPATVQPPRVQPGAPGQAAPTRRIDDRRPPPTATPGTTPPPPAGIQRAPATVAPPAAAPPPAAARPVSPPPAAARPTTPPPAAPPPAAARPVSPPPAAPPPAAARPAPPPAALPPAAVSRPAPVAAPPPAAVQRPAPAAAPPPAAAQRPAPQQQQGGRPSGQRDGDRRQRKPGEPDPPR
jgi:Family of unknown function (DUF6600)